jgi:DnaK suppressor protein
MRTSPDDADLRRVLTAERVAAVQQIDDLTRQHTGIVEASAESNADDEHDPEGATIAFEREQLSALLRQARARLADLDRALVELAEGRYGRCEECGGPIAPDRLAARPAARTCIGCASRPRR